jgi:predicted negative regulator of RcsB-dependent stress response
MNSTTTTSANNDLNGMLSESNVQGMANKNKTTIFVVLGVLVAAAIGFGLFKTFSDKSKTEYNAKIYAFESTVLANYNAKPNEPNAAATLQNGIENLHKEMGEYLGLLPLVIKSSDALVANSHFPEARTVLSTGEKIASDDYAKFFILSRQAVVYEDIGEDKLAIDTLEKMTSHSVKVFEGKTYLDLGRLYLKTNDKEKAKKSFTHVVEKNKEDAEFVKLAQLYLAKMK